MLAFPPFALVLAGLLLVACGDDASSKPGGGSGGSGGGSAASGGTAASSGAGAGGTLGTGPGGGNGGAGASAGSGGSPPDAPPFSSLPHHLGSPFRIVDGRIAADSNEYGLEASFYVVHNPKDSAANVTSSTGQVCLNGVLRRAAAGDFASYQGLDLGFSVGPTSYRTLLETSLSIAPDAPPWPLPPEVLGIAVTVTGTTPILFSFYATPGGLDPGGAYGVPIDVTLFGACGHPPVTSSGQVNKEFFGDLKNVWCIPEYQQPWSAPSVSAFLWSVGSQVVDQIVDGGLNDVTDPYDFCLRDLRPILAGAGPDAPLPDAGVAVELTDAGPDASE